MIDIRESMMSDVDVVAQHMRQVDQKECRILNQMTPRQSLIYGLRMSERSYTVTYKGTPIAIFGYAYDGGLDKEACAWFLGTNTLKRFKRHFIKMPEKYLKEMLEKYEAIYNYVSEDNEDALRFLKFHGFQKKDEKTKEGVTFIRLEKR